MITRACSGTASSRRRIRARSTIDASSSNKTSQSSGRSGPCLKRVSESGMEPKARCTVWAEAWMASRTASGTASLSRALSIDSLRRWAALPVGATSRMRGGGCPSAKRSMINSASSLTTVEVLPVPGPPTITLRRRERAATAASRWRSGICVGVPNNASTCAVARARTGMTCSAMRRTARATPCSWSK